MKAFKICHSFYCYCTFLLAPKSRAAINDSLIAGFALMWLLNYCGEQLHIAIRHKKHLPGLFNTQPAIAYFIRL